MLRVAMKSSPAACYRTLGGSLNNHILLLPWSVSAGTRDPWWHHAVTLHTAASEHIPPGRPERLALRQGTLARRRQLTQKLLPDRTPPRFEKKTFG